MLPSRRRKKRDETAWFDDAVDTHKDGLYTFARYYLRDEDDALDVIQDVLIRLWTHRAEIDRTNPGPWLRRVCRNACIDRYRMRKSRRRFEVHDVVAPLHAVSSDDRPDTVAHHAHLMQMVLAWLDEMDEPFRTLIILREIQELSYAEISAAVDLPLNTTKVYIHRARRRLRAMVPVEVENEIT